MSARFTLEQAAWSAGARIVNKGGPFEGVFTDTRHPLKNGLFVALKGDNFDASEFVRAAVEGGAAGALISADALEKARPQIGSAALLVARDSGRALGRLGAAWRRMLPDLRVVCVTGSTGKTST